MRTAFLQALAESAKFTGFVDPSRAARPKIPEIASVAPARSLAAGQEKPIVESKPEPKPAPKPEPEPEPEPEPKIEDTITPDDSLTQVMYRAEKELKKDEDAKTAATRATRATRRTAAARTVATHVTAGSVREIKVSNAEPDEAEKKRMEAIEEGRSSPADSTAKRTAVEGFDLLV